MSSHQSQDSITDISPVRAGVFENANQANLAIQALMNDGFEREQITVVCTEESRRKHFADIQPEPHATDATAGNEITSGVVGGLAGALVSLAAVATIGGLGIVAVGPILAGGITGTLLGALVGRGVEDEKARFYDQEVDKGNILVCVEDESEGRLVDAEKLLADSGALPLALDDATSMTSDRES